MCGDCLGLAGTLEHKQLGENGDRLEPDGEGPGDLGEAVFVGEDDGKNSGAGEEVLDTEGIGVGVVGGLVGVRHQVEDVSLGAEEEDLEDEVVDTGGGENVYRGINDCLGDGI